MGQCIPNSRASRRRSAYMEEQSDLIDSLHLTKAQGGKLVQFFQSVDADGSGEISIMEFLNYMDIDRTKFTVRAFSLFDADGSGELDVGEFIAGLYLYCTCDKYSLINYAFTLYDLDGSGSLDFEEMIELIREVYGESFENSRLANNVMDKIDKMAQLYRAVHREDFVQFAIKHPALLFPAFELQLALQSKVMGTRFWAKVSKQRYKHFDNVTELRTFIAKIKSDAFHELTGATPEERAKAEQQAKERALKRKNARPKFLKNKKGQNIVVDRSVDARRRSSVSIAGDEGEEPPATQRAPPTRRRNVRQPTKKKIVTSRQAWDLPLPPPSAMPQTIKLRGYGVAANKSAANKSAAMTTARRTHEEEAKKKRKRKGKRGSATRVGIEPDLRRRLKLPAVKGRRPGAVDLKAGYTY